MTTAQILISFVAFFVFASAVNIAIMSRSHKYGALSIKINNIILSWGSVAMMFYNFTAGAIVLGTLLGMGVFGTLFGAFLARKTLQQTDTKFAEVAKLCWTIFWYNIVRCFGFEPKLSF